MRTGTETTGSHVNRMVQKPTAVAEAIHRSSDRSERISDGVGHPTTYLLSYSIPMKTLLIATLLLCLPANLQLKAQLYDPVPSSPATPTLPVSSDNIQSGLITGPRYEVTDRQGISHTGTVVGDSKFSITIPDGPGPNVINAGGVIITQP